MQRIVPHLWYDKEAFGVSWQIVPARMNEILNSGDKEKLKRITEALLKIKKIDLEALLEA